MPLLSVPMRFPWTTSFVPSSMETPTPVFPEMTLPEPGFVPPIVLEAEPKRLTPIELPRARSPVTSVPM